MSSPIRAVPNIVGADLRIEGDNVTIKNLTIADGELAQYLSTKEGAEQVLLLIELIETAMQIQRMANTSADVKELNSVAKQVAATLSAPTAGVQTAHAFAKADYRSAEYLVKIANGSNTDVSKVLLTLDSSDNIAITEYGMVSTGSSLGSVSASISGANVQLLVTTANNTSTVTVVGTLLA